MYINILDFFLNFILAHTTKSATYYLKRVKPEIKRVKRKWKNERGEARAKIAENYHECERVRILKPRCNLSFSPPSLARGVHTRVFAQLLHHGTLNNSRRRERKNGIRGNMKNWLEHWGNNIGPLGLVEIVENFIHVKKKLKNENLHFRLKWRNWIRYDGKGQRSRVSWQRLFVRLENVDFR